VLLTPHEAAPEPPEPPPDRAARGPLRIVVADDAVLLREGLVRLLAEDGHQVVAAVGDGPALVEAVLRHRPDVSVVDVRMPPTHTDEGLRAAITARSHLPGAPMLVLSQYVEASYASDLLADGSGAVGYLLKDRVARVEEFLDALGRVAHGATVLDPQVIAQLLARQRRDNALRALTARERQLLALMAEGHSNTAIAQRLVVSASAVENTSATSSPSSACRPTTPSTAGCSPSSPTSGPDSGPSAPAPSACPPGGVGQAPPPTVRRTQRPEPGPVRGVRVPKAAATREGEARPERVCGISRGPGCIPCCGTTARLLELSS
jgi:DNA-binding NarL/FixJ family response regulator